MFIEPDNSMNLFAAVRSEMYFSCRFAPNGAKQLMGNVFYKHLAPPEPGNLRSRSQEILAPPEAGNVGPGARKCWLLRSQEMLIPRTRNSLRCT